MATQAISRHWSDLQSNGLDLGPPKGDERDAGYGGRLQEYERGTIFWHPSTDAHALRGRLLQRYLDAGGPGPSSTGERELGFPTSGHVRTPDGQYECATFEWGTIEDVPETPLVRIFGTLYRAWLDREGALGELGHPVSDVTPIPSGRVAWFQRGVLWHPQGSVNVLMGELVAPTLGQPLLVDPENPGTFRWIRFSGAVSYLDSIADLSAQIVANRLALTAVGAPATALALVHAGETRDGAERWLQLALAKPRTGGGRFPMLQGTHGALDLVRSTDGGDTQGTGGSPAPTKLERRRLYNLAVLVPGQAPITVSPHCLYARSDWGTFGIAHITDTHVSRRIDFFRGALRAAGVPESDIELFDNWNDRFREFIRYANHLHGAGLLDVIMLTGDLVDYVYELGEPRDGPGNFAFFEALVLGKAPTRDTDGSPSEELRVPLFTSLGNHDYRQFAYPLAFSPNVRSSDLITDIVEEIPVVGEPLARVLSLPEDMLALVPGLGEIRRTDIVNFIGASDSRVVWRNGPFNLLKSEALKIIGFKDPPNLRTEPAATPLIVDKAMRERKHFYFRHLNRERSYVVPLGVHRLVMLDTRWDDGIADGVLGTIVGKLGLGSEAAKNLYAGSPDSVGLEQDDLGHVRKALSEAGDGGIVIVGMHAPPLCPTNGEQPICLRETVHPTNDGNQVRGFLRRNSGLVKALAPSGWPLTGTPNFHVGPLEDMLDYSTSSKNKEELAEILVGRNADRPVNLVCSGHGHYRMEFRLRWNADHDHLETYTDYYLSTPDAYYPTKMVEGDFKKDESDRRYLTRIEAGAPAQGVVHQITEQNTIWPDLSYVSVPPYADPLASASDASAWWAKHSPVITQTAALGPADNTRASVTESKVVPGPNHQGFRIIQVANNVIQKVHYIGAADLRGTYPMAWEGPVAPQPAQPGFVVLAEEATFITRAAGAEVRDHRRRPGGDADVRDHRHPR